MKDNSTIRCLQLSLWIKQTKTSTCLSTSSAQGDLSASCPRSWVIVALCVGRGQWEDSGVDPARRQAQGPVHGADGLHLLPQAAHHQQSPQTAYVPA